MIKKKELFYLLGLLFIAITAYWQVSFFQYALKYDMIDCSYPWRYIVSEHLQNGMLPLWNPYQNLGYPLFADIQSGAPWYLPVWILSLLFGYNIYVLSFEFILHLFLAGVGMFFLGKTLKLSLNTAFIMGVAYMLSGFFVGNAQHFTLIAGATWIPFVLAGYFEIIVKNARKSVFKTAFFFFLLITGGYPTYIVTTAYILLILFITYFVILLKRNEKILLRQFLLNNLYLFIFTLLLSCVVILSFVDIAPELTRTEGIDVQTAMLNPFSPQCLLSLILPYAVIKDMTFFNTDLSMSNAYVGIILLVFLLFGFCIRKSKTYFFFLLIAIFSLLVAMGDYLPLRKLLYNYIPLMNLFRFPSVFRLFSIVGFIVCAGFSIDYFLKNRDKSSTPVYVISTVFILVFTGFIIYTRTQGYLEIKKFIFQDIFTESLQSKIVQHIVLQSVIQILVLLSFVVALRFFRNNTYFILFFTFLITFEMALAAQLNASYTIFYQNIRQQDVMLHHRTHFKSGFPVPELSNISENTNTKLSYGPFWRNMTIFHKQISNEGFTSLVLRNYRDLSVQYPSLLESITHNPPVFLTSNISPFDSINEYLLSEIKPRHIFVENETYRKISPLLSCDTSAYTLEIMEFKPNKITLKSSSSANKVLVLLQNNFKGWNANVNGKNEEIFIVDKSLMALYLPKGENTIVFTFNKPLIVFGFYITTLSLLVFMSLGIYYCFRKK